MEHPPTPSTLEDSARKFRLALAAVIDGSLPGLDPHLAKVLEATAAEVIARALNELEARDQTIAALYADRSMVIADTAALGQSVINDRDATIERLQDDKATLIRLVEDMSNEIVDRTDENTKLQGALDIASKDRSSIVAFLAAEAKRFDKEARERRSVEGLPERLRAYAILCRTLELAIERGDDRQGGE